VKGKSPGDGKWMSGRRIVGPHDKDQKVRTGWKVAKSATGATPRWKRETSVFPLTLLIMDVRNYNAKPPALLGRIEKAML